MKYPTSALFVLLLAMAGCTGDSIIGTDGSDAEVAAKAPTFVPIEGAYTFTGDLDPILDCGYGQIFYVRYVGHGDFDHMGQTEVEAFAEACEFIYDPPVRVVFEVSGQGTLTAANGDKVFIDWFMIAYPNPAGGPSAFTMDVEVTGGSGRFDGAGGFMTGSGQFNRATMLGDESLSGMISSVGSLKQK